MVPGLAIIDALVNIGGRAVDHFWPKTMSEEEREATKLQMVAFMQRAALEETSSFQQFILEYEGRAKDIPKSLVWLRSSIRPVLTYLIAVAYIYGWLGINPALFTPERMDILKPALLLVLGFWFGEKLLSRSGLVDAISKRRNGGDVPPI